MQKTFIGPNSLSQLSHVLDKLTAKNVLVFTLKNSFGPFRPVLESQLGSLAPQYYSDFSVNPKAEDIQNALKILTGPYDVIIAFGGGSVIDFAKLFRIAKDSNLNIRKYFYEKTHLSKVVPLIAIPTTFGTGSEATQFAVLYMDGEKYSVDDKALLPDYAFIDGAFSQNTPPYIKACSVMDAFSQAVESYWACGATPKSENYALQALALLHNKIIPYVCGGGEVNAQNIAKASHWAGKAINISRTTAAHALSYKITGLYGIPHGHAVALSLPKLLQFHVNAPRESHKDPRFYSIFRQKMNTLMITLSIDPDNIVSYFTAIYEKIGLEYKLGKLGIQNIDEIVEGVNVHRLTNNPVKLLKQDMVNMFIE